MGTKRCDEFVRIVIGARPRQDGEAERFGMISWVQRYLGAEISYALQCAQRTTHSIVGRSDMVGMQLWL
jgi:hypothetical protein